MTDFSDKTAPHETGASPQSADRQPATHLSARAQAAQAERQDRQAAALRANLLRRKAQARSRQDTESPADPHPSARPETGKPDPCP